MKKVLNEVLKEVEPDPEVIKQVGKEAEKVSSVLEKEIGHLGMNVEVFVGGSFAKGTLVKKDKYDADVFIRFDWQYEEISEILAKALKKTCDGLGVKYEKIHGSRDYFRVFPNGEKFYLEMIPVTKIKKPHEARNVTDLSYFHVPYIRRKLKGKEKEVLLAKSFCQAQRVYGAESYVQGFSGYALECLIVHYGTFEKVLKELVKVKFGERLVIDSGKHYKRRQDVFFDMNESKLHGPIVLVDPTFKERNVLAALSQETFERFQKSARKFLKNPSKKFFEHEEISEEKLRARAKKVKGEFVHVRIKTDRQEGDIAGTKMRRFAELLKRELEKWFGVGDFEFDYGDKYGQEANAYYIVKSKKEVLKIGPPVKFESKKEERFLKKHIEAFKREHKKVYEKDGFLETKLKVDFTAKDFLDDWKKEHKDQIRDMGIVGISVMG